MPVLDAFLAQLPAELDELAVPIRGEVDESFQRALELDAHPVQACHRFEELQLGAANRIPRLLVPIAIVSNYAGIWLVRRTSNEMFFRIAYILMFVIAVELIRSSVVDLWWR